MLQAVEACHFVARDRCALGRRLPGTYEPGNARPLVVRVVEILDDRLSVMQLVGVGHVVEEEQQVIGRGGGGFVDLRNVR